MPQGKCRVVAHPAIFIAKRLDFPFFDRLRRRHPTEELEDWRQKDESPGPMQGAHQHELGRLLMRSVTGLKEPYRSLVILRDIHQHSYQEVAAVLELSLSQVKVYLHRARKQLREQLAEVRP